MRQTKSEVCSTVIKFPGKGLFSYPSLLRKRKESCFLPDCVSILFPQRTFTGKKICLTHWLLLPRQKEFPLILENPLICMCMPLHVVYVFAST